jgi:hypothetical protein
MLEAESKEEKRAIDVIVKVKAMKGQGVTDIGLKVHGVGRLRRGEEIGKEGRARGKTESEKSGEVCGKERRTR